MQVFEEKDMVGGACRTEYPFKRAPGLAASTGKLHWLHSTYILGERGTPNLVAASQLNTADPACLSHALPALQGHTCSA